MSSKAAGSATLSPLARTARIALVFLLVFGLSFHAEIALAAGFKAKGLDKYDEDATITNLTVYQLDSADASRIGAAVRSATQTAEGKAYDTPEVPYADGNGSVSFVAVPTWSSDGEGSAGDDVIVADYVEWYVGGNQVSADAVLALTYASAPANVTCKLSKEAEKRVDPAFAEKYPSADFEVSFEVAAEPEPEPEEPTVDMGLELTLTGEGLSATDTALELTKEQGASYQFGANVRAYDKNGGDWGFEYTSGKGSLAEISGGLLTDLKRELVSDDASFGADVAEIDQTGLLQVKQDSAFKVVCTTTDGDSESWSASVNVTCGNPAGSDEDEQQGASHPQSSLRVKATIAGNSESAGESEQGSGEGSQSSSESASGSESGSSSSSSSGANGTILDKTYSAEEIEALGSVRETYTMQTASGAVTVTGAGPTLEALFEDAGIDDMSAVKTVRFVDYAEIATTVNWADLAASGASSPLLAVNSYVHEAAGADAVEDDAAATELLPNTRFRVLFDASSSGAARIDADALRWIKEIEVNPASEVVPDDPDVPFSVYVSYAPAPIGYDAVFSAKPSLEIGNATFDFTWEESSDGGASWETVGTTQTLTVKTTEANVGHLFRVRLDSDMTDEKTGKPYSAVSEPVEMVNGSTLDLGFIVQLSYDPPIAGGVALFQSSIVAIDHSIDLSNPEYRWEMSEDGGASWREIKNQTGPTFSVQTEKIDDTASSGDSPKDVSLIYIRVRVIASNGLVRVSNEQPLTVHVGDSGDDTSDSTDQGSGVPQNPGSNVPPVKLIENITIDNTHVPETPTVPTDHGTSAVQVDPSQVYINDDVSERVSEQQQAVQEHIESTVPGARWTSLSSSQATGDDVNTILSSNPFAPFAVPTSLGIAVAGGVEKLAAFRRQTK